MPPPVESSESALIVVDMQPDFLPGGSLEVGDGDGILPGIREMMESGNFAIQVATQDWHPEDHASFASSHQKAAPFDVIDLHGHEQILWPDHCVQGTHGAELHPELPWDRVSVVIRKGMDPEADSYSGFRNNWGPSGTRPPTGLAGYLLERKVDSVVICGLARDFCVRWTAEDAVDAGFETLLVWDLSRSVDPSGDEAMREELAAAGVVVLERKELELRSR